MIIKRKKTKQESNRYYQHKALKLCVRSAYTHTHTQKHERERLFLTLNTPKLDVTTRIEEKKRAKKKRKPATHQNNGISFTIKMVKRGQSSSTDISKKEKHKSKTAQRTYTRT